MATQETGKPFLDTRELATYLGVNEKQVYTLVRDRGLPGTRITGKWLFPRHLVDRWLEASVANVPEDVSFLERAGDLLLVAGSDDLLLGRLLGAYRHRHPQTIVLQSRAGSREGLIALKRGLCHAAAVHLPDPRGGQATDYLSEVFGADVAAVTLAWRTQGLVLPRGNPLGIRDLEDAIGRNLVWALRETGTGTMALLERRLEDLGRRPDALTPGSVSAAGHLETGIAILGGAADIGLGIQAVAVMLDLAFLPLHGERFDLVVRKKHWFDPPVSRLLEILQGGAFREIAGSLAGYDLSGSGTLLAAH